MPLSRPKGKEQRNTRDKRSNEKNFRRYDSAHENKDAKPDSDEEQTLEIPHQHPTFAH